LLEMTINIATQSLVIPLRNLKRSL